MGGKRPQEYENSRRIYTNGKNSQITYVSRRASDHICRLCFDLLVVSVLARFLWRVMICLVSVLVLSRRNWSMNEKGLGSNQSSVVVGTCVFVGGDTDFQYQFFCLCCWCV